MFKYLSLALLSLVSFAQITTLPPASGPGGGGITSSTATPTRYTLVMFDSTSNTTVAEATGCTVSGGVLSCTGGFNAGVGTNPAVFELPELTANGTNSNWIAGNTTQSANTCEVWPTVASTSGQALTDSGSTLSVDPDGAGPIAARTCRVLAWALVGGGGTIRTTYAALPVCNSSNNNYQYIFTDSIYTANCNSTSYAYWAGQKYIPTLPWSTGTTFGTGAIITATTGSVLFDGGAGTGGDSIRSILNAVPTAPYTIILDIDVAINATVSSSCGLVLTDGTTAASNKVITFMQGHIGLNSTKLTNATTWNSTYLNYVQSTSRGKLSIKMVDDNVNRTWFTSPDRINWKQHMQHARTDFLTATHYGYGCNMNGVSGDTVMVVEGLYAQ